MNISNYFINKSEKDIENIRKFLYKNYIKTVIERTELESKDNEYRIMLVGNRFKCDFKNPISFECNGAIISYNRQTNEFKTLVVPTELFNSQSLCKEEINKNIKQNLYSLYKVYDGTIVNLYFYKNSWRISTNKAYDATNLVFMDNKTYNNVLEELFSYYKDFNMSKLNTNKCYTICFKYDKFHTFVENVHLPHQNKLVLIQSVDTAIFNNEKKLIIDYNDNIGIPVSTQFILHGDHTLKNIYNVLYSEITRYKKYHTGNTYEPNYGLILRSHNFNKTKEYSNLLLESNLMSKIRNLLYNHSYAKKLNYFDKLINYEAEVNKKYYNMQDLNNLKMFLVKKDLNVYLLLFPQFKNNMEQYNTFVKLFTKYIIKNYFIFQKYLNNFSNIIKNISIMNSIPPPVEFNVNHNKLNKFALYVCLDLKNKKVNLNVQENYDILYDFLHNLLYIDYYYSCIHK